MEKEIKALEIKDKTIRRQREELRQSYAELENRLGGLNQAKASVLSRYDKNMGRVMSEIERQKRNFKDMPIGPIGTYVKILESKEKWADICENIFGRGLNGFLVTNYDDAKTLRGILEKCQWYADMNFSLIVVLFL